MKKILATGIALLSVVPHTFAQNTEATTTLNSAIQHGTIDNRNNPMNTPLGTVEDQYPKVAYTGATNTISNPFNTSIFYNAQASQETWKSIHCAIISKGFVWQSPVDAYANKNTCAGGKAIFVTTPNTSTQTQVQTQNDIEANERLLRQRQMVLDYIARLKGEKTTPETTQTTTVSTNTIAEEYKKLITDIGLFHKLNSLDTLQAEIYFEKLSHVFETAKKVPGNYKLALLRAEIEKFYKTPNATATELKRISEKMNFPALKDFVKNTDHLIDTDIAWVDFGLANENILITRDENIEVNLPVIAYNRKGEKISPSNIEVNISTSFGEILKNTTTEGQNIIFKRQNPNLTDSETLTITLVQTTTGQRFEEKLTTKYLETITISEQTLKPTDTEIILPNGMKWKIDTGLISAETKVKILAKNAGGYFYYWVVFAENNKTFANALPTISIASLDQNSPNYWTPDYEILENYEFLKHFSEK